MTGEEAIELVRKTRGDVPIGSVDPFNHIIEDETVLCFAVHLPHGGTGWIVRSDTGGVFDSNVFWRLYRSTGRLHT